MNQKEPNLEEISLGEKFSKGLKFWFASSSFVKDWENQGEPKDKVGETFMYLFEGIRLLAYTALYIELFKKYF